MTCKVSITYNTHPNAVFNQRGQSRFNSRPLVYVGDDINSRVMLTPGHFHSFNARTGFPNIIQNPAVYISGARVSIFLPWFPNYYK